MALYSMTRVGAPFDESWRFWGPYLSERQWGTVREDYSSDGNAWNYVTHDMARSKAFRWGEEGLAGISDYKCKLCFSLGFWNGKDPIIKERLFGLSGHEGNHAEDVKELYYYLDATPTHSYLKMLYKYPHDAFPYTELVHENASRDKSMPEYELLDTGVFDHDRYFDIFIEYVKPSPYDILIMVRACNRSTEVAPLWILPHIWFRDIWSWNPGISVPQLQRADSSTIVADHPHLGRYYLHCDSPETTLFCNNETNVRRLYGLGSDRKFFKDGINDYVVHGNKHAVNPEHVGTKAAYLRKFSVSGGGECLLKLRLTNTHELAPFGDFDALFERGRLESDEFYRELQSEMHDDERRNVQRQALAGMVWSKQFYFYEVATWLEGDKESNPPPDSRREGRNHDWAHLFNYDILSMPDKWEYPWFAAWDMAFHCIPLAMIDPEFAKGQLDLMTREWYMHPNGQLPAYEWNFEDVNPPVHAWAAWRVYQIDKKLNKKADHSFLERVFHKLLINFTWWVNKKDAHGRNLFQGGFLGLDNIGVFDRSAPLPFGGHINQADATSWMAMYCLNLLRMSLELALINDVYEGIATKFFEHFLEIAGSMTNMAGEGYGLWDDEDKFYYDAVEFPDGTLEPLKVRSMVGLIPLFAVETLEPALLERLPSFKKRLEWYLEKRADLADLISRWPTEGGGKRRLLSLLRGHRMKRLLKRMLDETEFLSPYGIRALSKHHEHHPYRWEHNGQVSEVRYVPGESDTYMFGGNSNWRGPVWFPVNYLIIESLQKFHHYYGDDFKIECPTGSGNFMTILEVAEELSERLCRLFLPDSSGGRPALKQYHKQAFDPHFREYVLFYEYFHGDNGRGVGAAHQTGWTGLVAKLLHPKKRARSI
jgi:hypothetical protein